MILPSQLFLLQRVWSTKVTWSLLNCYQILVLKVNKCVFYPTTEVRDGSITFHSLSNITQRIHLSSVTIQLRNNCFKVSHFPNQFSKTGKKKKKRENFMTPEHRPSASVVHPNGCHASLPTSWESCPPLSYSDPSSTAAPSHWLPEDKVARERPSRSIYTYGYKKWLSNTKHNLYNSKFLHMNHIRISLNFYCNSVFSNSVPVYDKSVAQESHHNSL